MGRWRAPNKPSSPYITAEGARRLKEELRVLWRETRPEVVKALSAAAAEGDRSENAEYTYRKKQLGGIDRRIRYLSKRLDVVRIVDRTPTETDRVRFGAWVELRDEEGRKQCLRIVGADETDASLGWISVDSPLARALLGRAPGETVSARLPNGEAEYDVLSVCFDDPFPQT
jgi:transcription elongation factor GreB